MKPGHHFAPGEKVRNLLTNKHGVVDSHRGGHYYAVRWEDGVFSSLILDAHLERLPTKAELTPRKRIPLV